MNILLPVKRVIERLPLPLKKLVSRIPFVCIVGRRYASLSARIQRSEAFLDHESLLAQMNAVLCRAKEVPFFQSNAKCYFDKKVTDLGGILALPITTKRDLLVATPEQRAVECSGRFLVNTGGTSGQPLAFYLNRECVAAEWAHMHYIWGQLGYTRKSLKLTFRGKDIGDQAYVYSPIHNEILLNTYLPWSQIENAILEISKIQKIEYLHGYPSILADFAENLLQSGSRLLDQLNSQLKGIFLASEYPAPHFRKKIEAAFKAPTVSWYGHSEMGLLAYEKVGEPYRYHVMQTYGMAEAIEDEEGDDFRLVCTSFVNVVSPFVRYDTGDRISDLEIMDGVLRSFKISSGRVGDRVVDRNGHNISLTALIHGRHHDAFAMVNHVQVSQPEAGRVILHIVPREGVEVNEEIIRCKFDLAHVEIDFDFVFELAPLRTPSGKLPLLIKT